MMTKFKKTDSLIVKAYCIACMVLYGIVEIIGLVFGLIVLIALFKARG